MQLLFCGFPYTWSEDIPHQVANWKRSTIYFSHIEHLVDGFGHWSIRLTNAQNYAELLLQSSWYVLQLPYYTHGLTPSRYLYEREMYGSARTLVDATLRCLSDKRTLTYAGAIDLSGLVDLDLNNPKSALRSFETALKIRMEILESDDDALIAFSLNNLALAYTELGSEYFQRAHSTHERAISIRLRKQKDRIGNSYSNVACLLLRMGRPDDAEKILKKCPSLQDFTDDTFIETGNPRFSGDMVLLSRIRREQGKIDDALRLASKALEFRKSILGNRLKTCQSLYDVASLWHEKGDINSAM